MTNTVTVADRVPPLAATSHVFDPRAATADDDIVIGHERVVLGYLLDGINAMVAREEVETIEGRLFYHPAHEHIFEAIKRHVGNPDVLMRVLEALIGDRPRALGMLDETPAVYLATCVKAADCFDREAFRRSAQRVREACAQRRGRVLIAEFGRAFRDGQLDAAAGLWATLGTLLDGPPGQPRRGTHRNVDLTAFIDGTHEQLKPEMGGCRDDGVRLLYTGLWHTVIAPNSAGKSWFALWHCIQEIRAGNTVVYAHFEEPSPRGTVGRLMKLAPDLSAEVIKDHFRWLDCSERWIDGEFRQALPDTFTLAVLDGINAACSQHGFDPSTPESLGWYKRELLNPIMKAGAAALSLGHPVKNIDRKWERHGFGYTGWLDDVNGIGYRLVPSKKTPIGKGTLGHSTVYLVKDRESGVQEHSIHDTNDRKEGWYRVGSFKVDDRPEKGNTSAWLNVPTEDADVDGEGDAAGSLDPIDKLADDVVELFRAHDLGVVRGTAELEAHLKAAGVRYANGNLSPALLRLETTRRISVTEGPRRRKDISLPRGEVASDVAA